MDAASDLLADEWQLDELDDHDEFDEFDDLDELDSLDDDALDDEAFADDLDVDAFEDDALDEMEDEASAYGALLLDHMLADGADDFLSGLASVAGSLGGLARGLGGIGSAVGGAVRGLGSIGGAFRGLGGLARGIGGVGGAVGRIGRLGGAFGGLGRLGGLAGRLGGLGARAGRLGGGLARLRGPLASRVGPMMLRQASSALGPWGALVRAGLQARRGAMGGGGLRGGMLAGLRGLSRAPLPGPWGGLLRAGLGAQRGFASRGLAGALYGGLGGASSSLPGLAQVLSRVGGGAGAAAGVERIFGALRDAGAGRGLGGLAGAFGALAPSGGRLGGLAGMLRGVLGGGDGADDDADLDALADMCDAGRIAPAVALPLGAALATRTVLNRSMPGALRTPSRRAAMASPAARALAPMIAAANRAPGTAGQRLRILRAIALLAVLMMRQRRGAWRSPGPMIRRASAPVLGLVAQHPTLGRVAPATAARKLAIRRRLLSQALGARLARPGACECECSCGAPIARR